MYPSHVFSDSGFTLASASISFQYQRALTSVHAQMPYTLLLYIPPSQFSLYQSEDLPHSEELFVKSVKYPPSANSPNQMASTEIRSIAVLPAIAVRI